jgi:uncharacterized protein (TIGR02996 family)
MSLKTSTANFERLAFEAAIKEHPGEQTHQVAFVDWLTDHGYTEIGARRHVTRMVREVVEARQVKQVEEIRRMGRAPWRQLRSRIVRRCMTTFLSIPTITIVPGGEPPSFTRQGGNYQDGNGYIWEHATSEWVGQRGIRYVPTQEKIKVGAAWCLRQIEELSGCHQS